MISMIPNYINNPTVKQRDYAKRMLEKYRNDLCLCKESLLCVATGSCDVTVADLIPLLPECYNRIVRTHVLDTVVNEANIQLEDLAPRVTFQQKDFIFPYPEQEEKFDHIFSFWCSRWLKSDDVGWNFKKHLKDRGSVLIVFESYNIVYDAFKKYVKRKLPCKDHEKMLSGIPVYPYNVELQYLGKYKQFFKTECEILHEEEQVIYHFNTVQEFREYLNSAFTFAKLMPDIKGDLYNWIYDYIYKKGYTSSIEGSSRRTFQIPAVFETFCLIQMRTIENKSMDIPNVLNIPWIGQHDYAKAMCAKYLNGKNVNKSLMIVGIQNFKRNMLDGLKFFVNKYAKVVVADASKKAVIAARERCKNYLPTITFEEKDFMIPYPEQKEKFDHLIITWCTRCLLAENITWNIERHLKVEGTALVIFEYYNYVLVAIQALHKQEKWQILSQFIPGIVNYTNEHIQTFRERGFLKLKERDIRYKFENFYKFEEYLDSCFTFRQILTKITCDELYVAIHKFLEEREFVSEVNGELQIEIETRVIVLGRNCDIHTFQITVPSNSGTIELIT